MPCFPREFSHQTADSQGYSATTRLNPILLVHYSATEEFTEGVRDELAYPASGRTDLFSGPSASLKHGTKRRSPPATGET
jgi:hypothetical protein